MTTSPNKMSIAELAEALKTARTQFLITNDKDEYDSSCPCSTGKIYVDGYAVKVSTTCWRVSHNGSYQELFISTNHPGKEKIAKILKTELDSQEWYNPYLVIWEEEK